MKKTISITMIVLSLIILVSAAIINLNVKDADIKIEFPEVAPNEFIGNLTYTQNGEFKTCFLDEKKISISDIKRCIKTCKIIAPSREMICSDKPTNIMFDGNKLQEVQINNRTYYSFNKTELEEKEYKQTMISNCKSNNYNWDGECFEIVTTITDYNTAVEIVKVNETTTTTITSTCLRLTLTKEVEEYDCPETITTETGKLIDVYQFKQGCNINEDFEYYCKERVLRNLGVE